MEAAGGVIFDNCVMGVLPVSRSLGHAPLKALILGVPSFSRTLLDLSTDDVLLLATDGVWDVWTFEQAMGELLRAPAEPDAAAQV